MLTAVSFTYCMHLISRKLNTGSDSALNTARLVPTFQKFQMCQGFFSVKIRPDIEECKPTDFCRLALTWWERKQTSYYKPAISFSSGRTKPSGEYQLASYSCMIEYSEPAVAILFILAASQLATTTTCETCVDETAAAAANGTV